MAEYTCYLRGFIKNSGNVDEPSLVNINPSQPNDTPGKVLVPNDTCIVWDKYNRFYFYKLKSGDVPSSLPDVVRVNSSLYWEIVYTAGTGGLQVEQVLISTLGAGSNVLVPHPQHDTTKSDAPSVRVIHGGKVKTSGIKISVVSNTQLRVTSLGDAFTDLFINIFYTPVL